MDRNYRQRERRAAYSARYAGYALSAPECSEKLSLLVAEGHQTHLLAAERETEAGSRREAGGGERKEGEKQEEILRQLKVSQDKEARTTRDAGSRRKIFHSVASNMLQLILLGLGVIF